MLCSKPKVERETFSSPFAQSGARIIQSPRDDHNIHFIFSRDLLFTSHQDKSTRMSQNTATNSD